MKRSRHGTCATLKYQQLGESMEGAGLQCHGCGSTNVVFDSKRRILKCNQCGKEEYYSRATLNSNGKVVFGKQNAMSFFNTNNAVGMFVLLLNGLRFLMILFINESSLQYLRIQIICAQNNGFCFVVF